MRLRRRQMLTKHKLNAFVKGMCRLIDPFNHSGVQDKYRFNPSKTDAEAIESYWEAVGSYLKIALNNCDKKCNRPNDKK